MIADPVNLHDWDCDNWNLVATVNQPITPVTCIYDTHHTLVSTPASCGSLLRVQCHYCQYDAHYVYTIDPPTYSVGFKEYVSQLRIGIIGTPTYLSYGYDSTTSTSIYACSFGCLSQ